MKAEDLMAGDFVKVKPSGMIIKVAAVHHKKVAYHAIQSKLEWVRQDLLEPISLKVTHLTKNGFEAVDIYDIEFVYNDGYEIKVFFNNYIKELELASFTSLYIQFAEKELWMQINYLHELQHALRLFGIKKEITL